MSKTAMKLALEALEVATTPFARDRQEVLRAQAALREALAEQPAQQEPVAWRTFDGEGGYEYRSYDMNEQYAQEWEQRNPKHKGWVEPLYKEASPCPTCEALARTVMLDQTSHDTSPPAQRKPLTDEEIWKNDTIMSANSGYGATFETLREIVRAIEAAHGIKENT